MNSKRLALRLPHWKFSVNIASITVIRHLGGLRWGFWSWLSASLCIQIWHICVWAWGCSRLWSSSAVTVWQPFRVTDQMEAKLGWVCQYPIPGHEQHLGKYSLCWYPKTIWTHIPTTALRDPLLRFCLWPEIFRSWSFPGTDVVRVLWGASGKSICFFKASGGSSRRQQGLDILLGKQK